MSLCIAASGTVIALVANAFSLAWTHSVEKISWMEQWAVEADRLAIVEASVQGSGAGIGLPDNAVRTDSGWSYRPELPPLPKLILASSGATVSAWTLCAADQCIELGAAEGEPVSIWPAPDCGYSM